MLALKGRSIAAMMAVTGMLMAAPAMAQDAKKAEDPVVAEVNGQKIHRSEVEALHAGLPARIRAIPMERIYKPLLEQVIAIRLLANAGRDAGLHKTDEVKKQLANLENRLIQEAYLRDVVNKKITDDALKGQYAEYVKNFKGAEEIRASHILVKTKKEAMAVIAELEKGENFDKLARAKSVGPSKSRGGDLGYFTKEQMVKPFAEAAFNLKKGEFSKTPVQTQFGWHVIFVADKRTKPAPEFDKVKGQLRSALSQKIAQAEIQRLREGATIKRFKSDGTPEDATPSGDDKKDK